MIQRHLAAFIGIDRHTGTRFLALDTTASGFALARTGATRNALFGFGCAGIVVQFIQFHVASPCAGTPCQRRIRATRRL
jgi:hypothetical protein